MEARENALATGRQGTAPGAAPEAAPTAQERPRKKKRRLRRRIKKFFSKRLARGVAVILPWIYYPYMHLVWRTSRVTALGGGRVIEARLAHRGVIVSLWHETVFFVAFSFREAHASTVAGLSDVGEVISRFLKRANFHVFRGGSSRGKSRRKRVLSDMVEHMNTHDDVLFGITPDGSSGPPLVIKNGVVRLSQRTGKPIFAAHITCRPSVRFPTWDGTRIPLPFGRIVMRFEGPILCPAETSAEEFAGLVERVQSTMEETRERAETWVARGVEPAREDGLWPEDDGYGPYDFRRGFSLIPRPERIRPVPVGQPRDHGSAFA